MENKESKEQTVTSAYYTPDMEDIYIGYELEQLNQYTNSWYKRTIQDFELEEGIRHRDKWRVPYLTKEQIEAEGWKFTATSVDLWFEKEGDVSLGFFVSKYILHYGSKEHPKGSNDCRLRVYADDCGSDYELFRGECKSINEFRKIIKWIGLQ